MCRARTAAILLFALVCTAPLVYANDDELLLDSPLFKADEESMAQPQRTLMTTTSTAPTYSPSYGPTYGPSGTYPPSYPPTYSPTSCGAPYEVYFLATNGVKNKSGVPKWGLTRDRLWAPRLKVAAAARGLPWKFPVTNFSRCVFQKTKAFTKLRFHARIVCNLTDISCSRRPGVRNAFRNAAKKGAAAFIVANKI